MFWESVLIAFDGLKANKLRSILTMLGIIIGVGAVIAMLSVGKGVQQRVESSIASLGSNLLIVLPGCQLVFRRRPAGGGIEYNPDQPGRPGDCAGNRRCECRRPQPSSSNTR